MSRLHVLVASLAGAVAMGATVISQSGPQVAPADLVLRGGRIVTLDSQTPTAQALAARNGAIVALGSDAAIARYIGPATQVIDLAGKFAMPGFIDGHGHFTGVGESRLTLNFMGTRSWDEIVHMVAVAVENAKPGEWIVGRGWHQDKWTSRPDPNVEGLPAARRARPGLAEQSRRARARERPRVVRQCESDGALRHHEGHGEPHRRRDPEGQGRQSHGPDARDGARPGSATRPDRGRHPQATRARRRRSRSRRA